MEERDCKLRNENEEQREIDRHSERVAKTAARIEERVPGVLEKWRAALDALESEIVSDSLFLSASLCISCRAIKDPKNG